MSTPDYNSGVSAPTTHNTQQPVMPFMEFEMDEDLKRIDEIENILSLNEDEYPKFTLAKNKARFQRMLSWYKAKESWLEVAPLSGVNKLFKQQSTPFLSSLQYL